jgi:quercetin dioxygenase-like cupin family protein
MRALILTIQSVPRKGVKPPRGDPAIIPGMSVTRGGTDVRIALFGGTGSVTVSDLLGPRAAPPFSAVLFCELDPGGSVGSHQQQRDPELVLGLEGKGEASVQGSPAPLEPGSVVYVPFGATLSLRNLSPDEPLRYLIIKAETLEPPRNA